MATKKEYGIPGTAKADAEPVNSEQLEALSSAQEVSAPPAPTPGPTVGEFEERMVEAEDRADAAERRNSELEGELQKLQAQIQALLRAAQAAPRRSGIDEFQALDEEGVPVFDESLPHGIGYGDEKVAYVQNGHQFGRDRQYLATEKNRGVPRAFNPRLVGYVKPRFPGSVADPFEGIRDQTWT